jgi:hypothetical protein
LQGDGFDRLLSQTARLTAEGMEAEFCEILEHISGENRFLVRAGARLFLEEAPPRPPRVQSPSRRRQVRAAVRARWAVLLGLHSSNEPKPTDKRQNVVPLSNSWLVPNMGPVSHRP